MPDTKVILVLIDGLSLRTAVDQMGYMEGLCQAGRAQRRTLRTALPSLSRPLYETVHTGVAPETHGITSNDVARLSNQPHVFGTVRAQGGTTGAAAYGWMSELYNEAPYDPVRHREVDEGGGAIQHGRFYTQEPYPDVELFHDAELLLDRYRPDYMLIHPMGCDHMGHAFGGNSVQYRRAAAGIDDILARSMADWRGAGYEVIVTADHGMDDEGWHGGTADEVTLIPFYYAGERPLTIDDEVGDQRAVAPTVLTLMGISAPESMTVSALVE